LREMERHPAPRPSYVYFIDVVPLTTDLIAGMENHELLAMPYLGQHRLREIRRLIPYQPTEVLAGWVGEGV
jgi:hypothetical protein